MMNENDFVTLGAGFPAGELALGEPSNNDSPAISFEEAVRRFRCLKYMKPEELRTLTFHEHAWRREHLRWIAELERRLRTVF